MARLTQDQVISGLVARGVPAHVAQGVAMNFRDESGFDTGIQELNPHNGRGGYGLAQWTGPRRVALENYAASQGRPSDDPDLQLDYFMQENAGAEKNAWDRVMGATTPQEAAVRFVNEWERPAAQHAAARSNKYQGVGGAGVSVSDPTTDRTRPWNGPPEVVDSQGREALAAAVAGAQGKPKSVWEDLASGLGQMKFGGGGVQPAGPLRQAEAPARVDAEAVAPVVPLGGDRRQALAELVARLNSGRLF